MNTKTTNTSAPHVYYCLRYSDLEKLSEKCNIGDVCIVQYSYVQEGCVLPDPDNEETGPDNKAFVWTGSENGWVMLWIDMDVADKVDENGFYK